MTQSEHSAIIETYVKLGRRDRPGGDIAQEGVFKAAKFLETFVAYPPSQKAPSFSVDQIVENVKAKIAQMKATSPPGGSR
jgi:hypothetical protein